MRMLFSLVLCVYFPLMSSFAAESAHNAEKDGGVDYRARRISLIDAKEKWEFRLSENELLIHYIDDYIKLSKIESSYPENLVPANIEITPKLLKERAGHHVTRAQMLEMQMQAYERTVRIDEIIKTLKQKIEETDAQIKTR
jgi:hypothetical protein